MNSNVISPSGGSAHHCAIRSWTRARKTAARPGMSEIREVPSVGHEAVKRVSEPEGGLDRVVGQVVRREEATIFFRMPLPRHRSVRAFTAQDRDAVDPIVNSNTHDDIA